MTFIKACLVLSVFAAASGNSNINIKTSILYAELAAYSAKDPETYLQAILPGTKWCGDGDIAENYDDLGFFKKTDMCCRDHDHCDDTIAPGQTKYGLTNKGLFTRLHCKCDMVFYECLKNADKIASNIIGIGYFNGLNGKCYEEKPPATCVKYESINGFRERCVEYSYDSTQPKTWQWFDVPRFVKIN